MKAKKLKSGSYRIQVYAGKDANGKQNYVSFTHPNKKEAERQALEFKLHHKAISRDFTNMTLGEAMDKYIESKDGVLSPTTILGYKRQRKNYLQGIINKPLNKLTSDIIQNEINAMAKSLSPKTVRNAHGFLSAVIATYSPYTTLQTTLPQKRPNEDTTPTEADIRRIIEVTKGTEIELPILLALWFGLRMSEIRGIQWSTIKGDTLYIKQAMVDTESGSYIKTTKSHAGHRMFKIPTHILNIIQQQPKTSEFITSLSGQAIYKRFSRICEKHGIPHYKFHSLRHANASVMLALGVPDKYAMERGGWATNHTMKQVYQHTMSEQRLEFDRRIDRYFNEVISHEISHDN